MSASPKKILLVARRDFIATVLNRRFLVGLLLMPAMVGLLIALGPRVLNSRSPQVRGSVAVIDVTGKALPQLKNTITESAIEARRTAATRRAVPQVPDAQQKAAAEAVERVTGRSPVLTVVDRPADADPAREKEWLTSGSADDRHLALIVMHSDAVERQAGEQEFGTFDLYATAGLDGNTETAIYESVREALVDARVAASGIDRATIDAMTRVLRPSAVVVSAAGEHRANREFAQVLPFALGILMFVGIMIGGQSLMTMTVEEKSSRVIEVLLAAVSPFELMAGKLLGQLGASLMAIALYVGVGLFALYSLAMIGLIDPLLVIYLIVFFLLTFLVFGALMVAIGASVNQMSEAQSLFGPVMLLLMVPYMLSGVIGRAPNSTIATAMSFIPPFNTFTMMTRLASDAPPPVWQVLLTVLIGLGAAYATVWFAAKVFKIGLLMHGKPPTFATMIRWARAA